MNWGEIAMKRYSNPFDLIADTYGSVLEILTDAEKEYLRGVLDFEAIALDVHDGIVDVIDTISGDVLNSEPIAQFVRESVQFAMADAE